MPDYYNNNCYLCCKCYLQPTSYWDYRNEVLCNTIPLLIWLIVTHAKFYFVLRQNRKHTKQFSRKEKSNYLTMFHYWSSIAVPRRRNCFSLHVVVDGLSLFKAVFQSSNRYKRYSNSTNHSTNLSNNFYSRGVKECQGFDWKPGCVFPVKHITVSYLGH